MFGPGHIPPFDLVRLGTKSTRPLSTTNDLRGRSSQRTISPWTHFSLRCEEIAELCMPLRTCEFAPLRDTPVIEVVAGTDKKRLAQVYSTFKHTTSGDKRELLT